MEPWRLRPKGEGHGRQAPAFPTRREHAQPSFWNKPLPTLAWRIAKIILHHSAWPGHPKPKHSMPILIRSISQPLSERGPAVERTRFARGRHVALVRVCFSLEGSYSGLVETEAKGKTPLQRNPCLPRWGQHCANIWLASRQLPASSANIARGLSHTTESLAEFERTLKGQGRKGANHILGSIHLRDTGTKISE